MLDFLLGKVKVVQMNLLLAIGQGYKVEFFLNELNIGYQTFDLNLTLLF